MTKLESNTVDLTKSPKEVFDFLSDFSHFEKLMPAQVVDWKLDDEGCTFTIKGMASLGLKYQSKTPDSEIVMASKGKSPFEFTITTLLKEGGTGSQLQFVLNADLNPFLKMMAEKPLINFLNMLADKMKEIIIS